MIDETAPGNRDGSPGGQQDTQVDSHDAVNELKAIRVGETIGANDDRFELLKEFASGPLARVFLAKQQSMNRRVALKISTGDGYEPQTLSQLDHAYIVRVFDARPLKGQGLKLMYMEYVPGGTLSTIVESASRTPSTERSGQLLLDAIDSIADAQGEERPGHSDVREDIAQLSWPETVAWLGRRLADALYYAARQGVLHRDIKPANVLLTLEGAPKLADFNVSYSTRNPGVGPEENFGGTLSYMSPEQLAVCDGRLRAEFVREQSDIYSLGVVLLELLTARHPYREEAHRVAQAHSLEQTMAARAKGIERAMSTLPSDCPETLSRVLRKCLAPAAEDRWSSGAEVALQLELCLDRIARDLVDPPAGSVRAWLGKRPIPVVITSVLAGQALGLLYVYVHNYRLVQLTLTPEAKAQLDTRIWLVIAILTPLSAALMFVLCRRVLAVPWKMWKGRPYKDADELNRARADTLVCGDRIAISGFASWIAALLLLGGAVATVGDGNSGLIDNLTMSHLVAAAAAVMYPLFPIEFYIVRWYLPALLTDGTTSAVDAWRLRSLARRCYLYLALVVLVPAVGVITGNAFLNDQQVQLVMDSGVWVAASGIAAVLGALVLFWKLQTDLAALERVVASRTKSQQKSGGIKRLQFPVRF